MPPSRKIILTGIRASGDIHLGNYLGAIRPALARAQTTDLDSYFFVADLHGLTTTPKPEELKRDTHSITAAWLASGLDPKKCVLWKQSDVPEVLELAYLLGCVTSMGLMERAHSYKDALQKDKIVKVGLFYYPILMAADILLYDTDLVPVGKDQAQHLEMTRDMATFFNEAYGETFKLPDAVIQAETGIVPGVDGRKMSKSYGNGIELFAPEAVLKKQVMSIQTDSKSLDEPKDPETCLVYQIFKLVGSPSDVTSMHTKLAAGGYGYGDAKKWLLATLIEGYGAMRKDYERWMKDPASLEECLKVGAEKARDQAAKMLGRVRQRVGL